MSEVLILRYQNVASAGDNIAARLAELDVWSFADEIQRSGIMRVKEDPRRCAKS